MRSFVHGCVEHSARSAPTRRMDTEQDRPAAACWRSGYHEGVAETALPAMPLTPSWHTRCAMSFAIRRQAGFKNNEQDETSHTADGRDYGRARPQAWVEIPGALRTTGDRRKVSTARVG